MAAPAKTRASVTADADARSTGKIVREFAFDHDTKNAIQFKQDEEANGSRAVIGTIYVTKEGITKELKGKSNRIRVTIEAVG